MITIHVISWLFAALSTKKAISEVDKEIEAKSHSIKEWEKGIEANQPLVEEAIKRTDDSYYVLRNRVAAALRRKEKTESDVFIQDLKSGWRRSNRDGS